MLPTLRPFPAAANAVAKGRFQEYATRQYPGAPGYCFDQRYERPPRSRTHPGPRPDLSTPFAPPAGAAPPAPKKQKRRKRELQGQLRSYKVRMIPTAAQAKELKRCFSAARHAYNATVNAMNDDGARANFYERRAAFKARTDRPTWAASVSVNFIDGGIEAAVNAVKTNLAKRALNPAHAFRVHRISHRRTKTEVLRVEGDGDATTKQSTLLRFERVTADTPKLRAECLAFFGCNLKAGGGIRLQDKGHVIDRLLAEGGRLKETCRIQWEKRTNQFYFIYVYDLPPQPDPDPQFATKRLVATDPGVRTFQTWYSPTSGEVGSLFHGGGAEIERRCFALDRLVSRVAKRGNALHSDPNNPQHAARFSAERRRRTLRGMRRRLARDRLRLRGWVEAGHHAAANFLLRRFDVIIAPRLAVAEMVPRDGRVFGSRTARAMLTWSHGLFTARLESAAFRYPGRHVISDSGEPGTSKTCAHCGRWNAALGGSAVFQCGGCGVRLNRDVAGARNNFFAAFGRACGMGWDGIAH